MKIVRLVCALSLALVTVSHAQSDPPELSAWHRNTTGATGYGHHPADVQIVRYSASNIFVNGSGIPAYSIGPWPGNPNTPTNERFVIRIPRNPTVNGGTKTQTPLGPIAIWVNGVVAFNAKDAQSYQNQNVWHQNAVVVEGPGFDSCLGHAAPGGFYHHHQNPRCLYPDDPARHSPILGYAYDGFPIYGPYAYANTNGSGGITRLRSSYQLRNITQRHTLPDGTELAATNYGPDVSVSNPLGYYIEDFAYTNGLGDLDEFNGRFSVTPDYPQGTYAYFVTVDAGGTSAYPYIVGPSYNGVVANDDLSTGGHVTIGEAVTNYAPSSFEIDEVAKTGTDIRVSWSTVGGRTNIVQAGVGDGYSNQFADASSLIIASGTGAVETNYMDAGGASNAAFHSYRIVARIAQASDNAADTAYNGGWTNGSSGGSGFGPWILTGTGTLGSGSNGYFVASSTNNAFATSPGIDTGNRSWGIYASTNNFTAAYRPFAGGPLFPGQSLQLDMDNGFIDGGNSVGFTLRSGNASGGPNDYNVGARFEFLYIGNDASNSYKVVDAAGLRNVGVPFTGTGLRVIFSLATEDTYALQVIDGAGATTNTIAGDLAGKGSLESIAVYNRNAGAGSTRDAFFNSVLISPP